MIAIAQEQATCKQCGRPIVVNTRGPHKREFCSQRCKQAEYRARQSTAYSNVTMDGETQQRITGLEAALHASNEQTRKLTSKAAALEREVQHLERILARRDDRLAQLERENKDLQERLDMEERFRTDVEVRTFKSWLRTHPQPRDTDFAKRFLDDREMPLKASRSKYEAQLHRLKYSEEDVLLFRDAWKDMLLLQS